MFDLLTTLGRTMGFSFAAGINLYATVAILGLAQRFGWVALPEQFRVFDNDIVIGVALVLYVVEFVADKIPWVDSHVGRGPHRDSAGRRRAHRRRRARRRSPSDQGLVALLGGSARGRSALHQGRTRAAANTSPEPFSNWILSLAEDVFVIGLSALALKYPIAAALVVIVSLVMIALFATWIVRAMPAAVGGDACAVRVTPPVVNVSVHGGSA